MKDEKRVDRYLRTLLFLLLVATSSTSMITLQWVNTGEPVFLVFSLCFFSLYIFFFLSYKAIIRKDFSTMARFLFLGVLIIYVPEQLLFKGFGVYQLILNFTLLLITAIYAFPKKVRSILFLSSLYFFFLLIINIIDIPWRINPFNDNLLLKYQGIATILPLLTFIFIIIREKRYNMNLKIFTGMIFTSLVPIILSGIFDVIRVHKNPLILNIFNYNNIQNNSRITQNLAQFDKTEFFMLFIFVNFIVFISKIISDFITEPIKDLIDTSRKISSGNFNIKKPDDDPGDVNYIYNTLYHTSKSFSDLINSFQDEIYEKSKAEEELKRTLSQLYLSEMELNYIAESTKDVIWTMDPQFRFKYISPASIRHSGFTPEEIKKQSLEERYTPETVIFLKELWHKTKLTEGKAEYKNKRSEFSFELQQYAKDGRIIIDDVRATLVYDELGYISEMFGITRDITERKNFEEELKKTKSKLEETIQELKNSEINFRFLAENTADVIWTINPQLQVEYVSPSIKELQGLTPEEAISYPWEKKLTPTGMKTFLGIAERFLSTNGDPEYKNKTISITDTIEQIHKDGHTFWTEITLNVIYDEKGYLLRAVGVTRNINERKLYEDKIELMNKKLIETNKKLKSIDNLKTELLSNVSHELRTPLAAIKGYSDLIHSEKYGPITDKQRHQLDVIKKNINHLTNLIDGLLSYSRLYFGKNTLDISVFPIIELINSSIETINEKHNHKNFIFNFYPQQDHFVKADYVRIKQVILNLLDNSCKFSEPGTEINIDIKSDDDNIFISIKDNGIGIPEDVKDHIFERFYQVDSSTTRKYGGIGLGLSIVKKILDLHESHIELESSKEKGTFFCFSLKLSKIPAEDSNKENIKSNINKNNIGNDQKSVLIIDDQKDILDFLSEMFELEGIKAYFHNSSEGILNKINIHKPSILLLDISLGGEDGLEILKYIRNNNINIPIIMLSAFTEDRYRQKAKEYGAVDYITKPFDMDDLLSIIKNHF